MITAEGCLAIIRTTRAGPVVKLVWKGEKTVGTSLGPRWVPQAFLADNVTIHGLRPAQSIRGTMHTH